MADSYFIPEIAPARVRDWENISAADLMLPRDEPPQPEANEDECYEYSPADPWPDEPDLCDFSPIDPYNVPEN